MSDSEQFDEKETRWFGPGELAEADAEELPTGVCSSCGYEESESEPEAENNESSWVASDPVDRNDADWKRVVDFANSASGNWPMADVWLKISELERRMDKWAERQAELERKIEKLNSRLLS